jgi:hypothetical protein
MHANTRVQQENLFHTMTRGTVAMRAHPSPPCARKYILKVEASQVPNETNTDNNVKIDGLIFIQEPTPTKFKLIVNVTDNKENSISNAIVYANQEGRSTEGDR